MQKQVYTSSEQLFTNIVQLFINIEQGLTGSKQPPTGPNQYIFTLVDISELSVTVFVVKRLRL